MTNPDTTDSDLQQQVRPLLVLILDELVQAIDPDTGAPDDELFAEICDKLNSDKPRFVRIGLDLARESLRFNLRGLEFSRQTIQLHDQLRNGVVPRAQQSIELESALVPVVATIPAVIDPELKAWDELTAEDKLDIAAWVEAVEADADRRLVLFDEVLSLLFYRGGNYLGWYRHKLSEKGQKLLELEGRYRASTKIGILEDLLKEMRPLHEQRIVEAKQVKERRQAAERAERDQRKAKPAESTDTVEPSEAPIPVGVTPTAPRRKRLSAKEQRKRSKGKG